MNVRHYVVVTAAYWSFTLTDGALRMLVLLHFHELGYTPIELAFLFLLYELFGIVTNLVGGWLAARTGVRFTLVLGLALQAAALVLLAFLDSQWSRLVSVSYVMACQALSGIAKDLTKMSAKSAVKTLVPPENQTSLFRWVAILTGSKNALKGLGFFLGGVLLSALGFRAGILGMAAALTAVMFAVIVALPAVLGKPKQKAAFESVLSTSAGINRLSVARMFLFSARDVWFVVSVPVFLASNLGWGFTRVGGFLAAWVIGYGAIQAAAPGLLRAVIGRSAPGPLAAGALGLLLAAITSLMPLALHLGLPASTVVIAGLGAFGVIFALNSSVHSYLVLAYADDDRVSMDVGFYYMANAAGRLMGTLLSGVVYQWSGLVGTLWAAAALACVAGGVALTMPPAQIRVADGVAADD